MLSKGLILLVVVCIIGYIYWLTAVAIKRSKNKSNKNEKNS